MPSRQSLLFNKCPLNLTSQSPDPRTPLRHLELNTGGELAYPISVLTALSVCRNGTAFQALDFIKTTTFKFLELAESVKRYMFIDTQPDHSENFSLLLKYGYNKSRPQGRCWIIYDPSQNFLKEELNHQMLVDKLTCPPIHPGK